MGSLTGIRQSSLHGRVTHRDSRGQLASRVRALVLAEGGGNPAAGSHTGIRESARRQGQQGTKKRRSEERRPSRITTGANQIRPES